MRCMKPPASAACPAVLYPVTRLTDSLLQKVRTSANICGRPVRSFMKSIEMPFSVSFSVASMYGSRTPSQSNDELRIASPKSQLG